MALANILTRILETKREEVAAAKRLRSAAVIEAGLAGAPAVRDFTKAIRDKHAAGQAAVIAEIKRGSPSAGMFRADDVAFDPAKFAASYERHGAACLSVLTDRDYFFGSADDLKMARASCGLPVLRKDFIIDPYQILEAREMGADAVLFIMGCASIAQFREWEKLASALGMAVLAESHSGPELDEALTLATPLIGINNRDLTTFSTRIDTTLELKARVPGDRIVITESGMSAPEHIDRMLESGVNTYLVGGALMQATDPGRALADLFAGKL